MRFSNTHTMTLRSPFKTIDDLSDNAPPHPGEVLREDMLPHFKITAAELARHIGVPRHTLDTVMAERAPMTGALAERLGSSLGHGARYWHHLHAIAAQSPVLLPLQPHDDYVAAIRKKHARKVAFWAQVNRGAGGADLASDDTTLDDA